jgi:hypothetical protein
MQAGLSGAAQESNLPTDGQRQLTGFLKTAQKVPICRALALGAPVDAPAREG